MVRVLSENFFQKEFCLLVLTETDPGLRFEEARGEKLGFLQILVEEQHRGQ